MKKEIKTLFCLFVVAFVSSLFIIPVNGVEVEVPLCAQGDQYDENGPTDSIFRICMPQGVPYNGRFIIWAHGFVDATPEKPVIPEGQLNFGNVNIQVLVTSLGFGFATTSYRKAGLAVQEGMEDIRDLVEKLTTYGRDLGVSEPDRVYIIGASEGGLITTLLAEENPPEKIFAAYALCGPIGDFPLQINYLGDARVTFEYFFPGRIPGYGIFNGINKVDGMYIMSDDWDDYFDDSIKKLLLDYPWRANQWAKVAKIPRDPENIDDPWSNSAKDVLRFPVVWPNLMDAEIELGGFPYDNCQGHPETVLRWVV